MTSTFDNDNNVQNYKCEMDHYQVTATDYRDPRVVTI